MTRTMRCTLTALALFLAAGQASANDNLWLGVKAGTLGAGLEATWQPIPWLDVRAGVNKFDYDDDGTRAGIPYEATLELQSLYATANFRVPLSPLRFSAGAFANDNRLVMQSSDAATYDVGGNTYTSAQAGRLRSTASFDSPSPYLGVGFDIEVLDRLALNLDLGVLWQGKPSVTLTSDGFLADDPEFQQALEEERRQLAEDAEDFKIWPVVSLGLHFNFF